MTTTPDKMSPQDFREPLLATLATLSNQKAGEEISFQDTYEPVCTGLGITLDQFGVDDRGKYWVANWMLGAFRALKDDGLAMQLGRGKWGITDAGLVKITGAPAPATVTVVNAPSQAPAKPSLAIGPGQDESGYHPDPYIRALGAAATKCFGSYSTRSSVCGGCPLSGSCINMLASQMTVLAAKFAEEDRQAALRAEAERKKAMVQAAVPATPPPTTPPSTPAMAQAATPPPGGWDNTGAHPIISYMDAECYRCKGAIKQGEACFWIKDDGKKKGGLFHKGCM